MTAIARVDTAAFARNVERLVARAAPSEVMLAVKADAYGHGMLDLAPVALAAGASSLAVLEIPAALALRSAGIPNRLFAWLHGADSDFASAIEADIDLGVSSGRELQAITAAAAQLGRPARVHLKIDTGLRRNGALPEDWPALVTAAASAAAAGRVVIEGIWSHLADASVEDDLAAIGVFETALAQAAAFGVVPPLRHLAASSAGWREPRARYDVVRFGIAAYGVSPFDDLTAADMGLEAVMTLRTTVAPDAAPDGQCWIAAGYADGVPLAARGASVLMDGRRCAVDRVEVDRTLVTIADPVDEGSPVIVFGDPTTGAPTAAEWAGWASTIGDEIITGAGARARREVV